MQNPPTPQYSDLSPPRVPIVSLNLDVANLSTEAIERLLAVTPTLGRVLYRRAFGDFRREDLAALAVRLFQEGFLLVHCPSWPNGRGKLKSVVDDVMAQDLRDQLEEHPEIETFVLATGDRNFIAVANALKRRGRRVVVASDAESANRELRLCADEYICLSTEPAPPPPRAAIPTAPDRGEPRPLVETAPISRTLAPPRSVPPPPPAPVRSLNGSRPSAAPTVTFTDDELVDRVTALLAEQGELTLRQVLRRLLPADPTHSGAIRSRLANQLQRLAESGRIRLARGADLKPAATSSVAHGATAPTPAGPEVERPIAADGATDEPLAAPTDAGEAAGRGAHEEPSQSPSRPLVTFAPLAPPTAAAPFGATAEERASGTTTTEPTVLTSPSPDAPAAEASASTDDRRVDEGDAERSTPVATRGRSGSRRRRASASRSSALEAGPAVDASDGADASTSEPPAWDAPPSESAGAPAASDVEVGATPLTEATAATATAPRRRTSHRRGARRSASTASS